MHIVGFVVSFGFNSFDRLLVRAWVVYVFEILLFHLVEFWLVIVCLVYGLLLPTLLKPAKENLSEKEENAERPGVVKFKVIFAMIMVISAWSTTVLTFENINF